MTRPVSVPPPSPRSIVTDWAKAGSGSQISAPSASANAALTATQWPRLSCADRRSSQDLQRSNIAVEPRWFAVEDRHFTFRCGSAPAFAVRCGPRFLGLGRDAGFDDQITL